MKQFLISVLLLLTYLTTHAQEQKPINATDGTIAAYVEVTWTSIEGIADYKIIRSKEKDPKNGVVIENLPQDGIYGDRKATKGVIYYYWLKYADKSGEVMTPFDKGHRPLDPPVAIEQATYDAELYTSSTTVELADSMVIAQPEISGKWKPKRTVNVKTVLRYLGGNELTNVSVKMFVSEDGLLDNTDQLIKRIPLNENVGTDITEFDKEIKLPKLKYKNKNLILVVMQGEQIKAITVKRL